MSLRPPPKSPSGRRAIFAVLVLVSGVAGAADRAFLASNSTGSPLGRWVNVGTKNLTIHGTAYTVPCDSSSTGIAWSPHGVSIGTALDFNYGTNDLVWTSITGTNADTTAADAQNVAPCGASAGKKCTGVATYDVSSNALSRYFHPTFDETGATNPDVLGYGVRAVAINKAGGADSPAGSIKSWNTSGSGTAESMAPDKASCASNSPELQPWDATLTTGTKQASIVMPNGTDKPEGANQSVAVRRSVLTDQATFFKQNTNNIVPFEMSLGSTP